VGIVPYSPHINRLDENAAAADIDLSDEHLHAMEELFPPGAAAGDRHAPEGMTTVER
jgi:diketogulonate reductase-like aldo/keto reductase